MVDKFNPAELPVPNKNIAMIMIRDLDEHIARVHSLRAIRSALEQTGSVRIFRIRTLLESPSLLDCIEAMLLWLGSVLRRAAMPLQCVLYARRSDIVRIVASIDAAQFQAIYVDGVRCIALTRELREKLPSMRIVVDFDDLMSRYFALLREGNFPLSIGYVRKQLPRCVTRLIEGPLARFIVDYEARSLRKAEEEMLSMSDAVTLHSPVEAELLRNEVHASLRRKVHAILPPVEMKSSIGRSRPPFRFIFIGSDRWIPNKLSLDVLIAIWANLRPATTLHVYGSQSRKPPGVAGIQWHGFVLDLEDVYTAGSVLLIPAVVPGGIKSKILEAFSFGCAVLGNPAAFEGLDIPEYPLCFPEADWVPYLTAPETHALTIDRAADAGRAFVSGSRGRHIEAWKKVLKHDA
jgi:glycosyltransferase involved in cell wall biosynthesis